MRPPGLNSTITPGVKAILSGFFSLMIDPFFLLSLVTLGAFVGFMAGLMGVGGGGIMVPMLTTIFLWQGMPVEQVVHLALGTSMASIVITSFSSLRAHHKKGGVRWPVVKLMTPGIIVGTFLSTFLVSHLNPIFLSGFFAFFMLCIAIQMFIGATPPAHKSLPGKLGLSFTGSVIGGISALVSIGGGALSVPFLVWRNVDVKQAIGTSAALGFPIALSGALGYIINGIGVNEGDNLTLGYIYLPAVIAISVISVFFAPLGVKMNYRLPVGLIKKLFAILLFGLSVKMFISVFTA